MEKIQLGIRKELKALGIQITTKPEFDEYRVNFIGGKEATAYYTSDPDDAVNTGRRMATPVRTLPNVSEETLNHRPRTTTSVNSVLRKLGFWEALVRGRGYYYFIDGDSCKWYSSSVPVYRIGSYTVQGWLEQYLILKYHDSFRQRVEYRADGKGVCVVNRDHLSKKYNTCLFTSENVVKVIEWLENNKETK